MMPSCSSNKKNVEIGKILAARNLDISCLRNSLTISFCFKHKHLARQLQEKHDETEALKQRKDVTEDGVRRGLDDKGGKNR